MPLRGWTSKFEFFSKLFWARSCFSALFILVRGNARGKTCCMLPRLSWQPAQASNETGDRDDRDALPSANCCNSCCRAAYACCAPARLPDVGLGPVGFRSWTGKFVVIPLLGSLEKWNGAEIGPWLLIPC